MPLDPDAAATLQAVAAAKTTTLDTLPVETARAILGAAPPAPGPELHEISDRTVPGPDGPVPVRIYRPGPERELPLLVWFHGGGFTLGDLNSTDGAARHLAAEANCVVVSVEYRLAPEHPFPAPLEDAYAATVWAVENASAIGADPARAAVGGESSGATLATAVTLLARERSGPALSGQVLVCPMTGHSPQSASMRTESTVMLGPEEIAWFWKNYLGTADPSDPLASPAFTTDLSGLPPAIVVTAEHDALRDEGRDYAERLRLAGVKVDSLHYPGVFHGFFQLTRALARSRQAMTEVVQALRATAFAG
ncbi:alpha/beta hydrolase [Streptomyces sp. HM190]|uniref:alpha/beta hydrolase n=1 Tax=Streptomyces sp. HM190 TaxID=2695266 RepID=UPI001359304F|nr:alpha/beta hydrolase [Streptomyces sp. HM190]